MSPARSACTILAGLALLAGCGGQPGSSTASPPAHGSEIESPSPTADPTTGSDARPTRVSASYARWRLPFRVARSATIAVGGDPRHTLLAGGMLPGDSSTDQVTEIDPVTGRFTPAPALAVPVHDAAGGLVRGAPAVFGGGNATEQSLVQALHGRTWRAVAHLPTTRSDLSVVTAGATSLVIGGYDGTNVPLQILRVDRRPRTVGALNTGVRYAATAVVGRAAYVFGGEVDHQELDQVQRVDLDTGRSVVVGRLPRPLGHASAVAVGGRVLVLGGRITTDRQTDAIWWYDPATGHFTRAGRLPAALSDASAVAVGQQIWLLGGEDPGVTNRVVRLRVS